MRGLIRTMVCAAAVAVMLLAPAGGQAGAKKASLGWSTSPSGSYGSVAAGQTASQTFTLNARGKLKDVSVTLSGSSAFTITADGCSGGKVGAKSCDVTVQYSPTSASDTATLNATSKKRSAALTLTGSGAFVFTASGPNAPGVSPLNENPPHPESSATGTATVMWDTTTGLMKVDVVFSGLTTPNTAAHIHCCVAAPGNTGVATTVPTFTGFPTGVTNGTYSHTFNMLDASSYNPSFVTAHGGTAATAAAALFAGLQAGQAYVNIHTQMFPGGEARGFLQS